MSITSFIDSSRGGAGPHPITANGDAQIVAARKVVTANADTQIDTAVTDPFGGNDGVVLLDGTGDYLSIPDSDDWAFGDGDISIDLWVQMNSISQVSIVSQVVDINNKWRLFFDSGDLSLSVKSSGTWIIEASESWSPSTGTWYHLAYVREDDNHMLFVDGELLGVTSDSSTWPDFAATLDVGKYTDDGSSVRYIDGYFSDVRISKGIARYTSAKFTVPTAPQDPDLWTVLLIPGTGPDASTVIPDISYGAIGRGYATFDGTGDYLSIPDSDDWHFGDEPFTIEFWVNLANTTQDDGHFFNQVLDGDSYIQGSLRPASGTVRFESYVSSSLFNEDFSVTFTANQWDHIALTWDGSNIRCFHNGSQAGSNAAYTGSMPNIAAPLNIGRNQFGAGSGYLNGRIDDYRISKGIVRYTTNSIPEAAPFESDDHTMLLLHMDVSAFDDVAGGGNAPHNINTVVGNARIATYGNHVVTANGDAQISTKNAHTVTANGNAQIATRAHVVTANGDAVQWPGVHGPATLAADAYIDNGLHLDGTGDYASYSDSSDFNATTNCKWEFWCKPKGISGTLEPIAIQSTALTGWEIWISNTGITFSLGNASSWFYDALSSFTFEDGIWYDVVISIVSGNLTITVSGTEIESSTAIGGTPAGAATALSIGAYRSGTPYFNGVLRDFKFTKSSTVTLNVPFIVDAYDRSQTASTSITGMGVFDGNDYLGVPGSSDFDVRSGDFTFECWFRAVATAYGSIFSVSPATDYDGWGVGTIDDGTVQFNASTGGSAWDVQINGGTYTVGTWHHLAVSRDGSTFRLFLDGTVVASDTNASDILSSPHTVKVAAHYALNVDWYFGGYLGGLRLSKGIARYTTAFTPQTTPFVDDLDTALLLPMNGDPGSTDFVDEREGTYGTFDGTGDYLSIPDSSDYDFGTGDYTIEFWMYPDTLGDDDGIFGNAISPALEGYVIQVDATSGTKLKATSNASGSWAGNLLTTNALVTDQWQHVALVRNGNTLGWYIDGVANGTLDVTGYTYDGGGSGLTVGRYYANVDNFYFEGRLTGLRISKGLARYTAAFTPPTRFTPWVDDRYTVLILNMLGAAASTTFDDGNAPSVVNNCAMVFDGTGDYLDVAYSPELSNWSTEDYLTIEFWVRTNAYTTGLAHLIGQTETVVPTYDEYWFIYIYDDGDVGVGRNGLNEIASTSQPISLGVWHHVAVVKSGSTTTIYADGTSVASGTTAVWNGNSTNDIHIGGVAGGRVLDGAIGGLMVSRGIARYTTTFTPALEYTPDKYSVLLLQPDISTDGSANIIDQSVPTRFGSGAAYFDGASALYIENNPDWSFGTGDFTVEGWFRTDTAWPGGTDNRRMVTHGDIGSVNGSWTFGVNSPGGVRYLDFAYRDSGGSIVDVYDTVVVDVGTWYHLAAVRSGTTLSLYLDGSLIQSATVSENLNAAAPLVIGCKFNDSAFTTYNEYMHGEIDELRISKVARYTTAFTPATEPFSPLIPSSSSSSLSSSSDSSSESTSLSSSSSNSTSFSSLSSSSSDSNSLSSSSSDSNSLSSSSSSSDSTSLSSSSSDSNSFSSSSSESLSSSSSWSNSLSSSSNSTSSSESTSLSSSSTDQASVWELLACSDDSLIGYDDYGDMPDSGFFWVCESSVLVKAKRGVETPGETPTTWNYLEQCGGATECADLLGYPASDAFDGSGCGSGAVGDDNWDMRFTIQGDVAEWSIVGGQLQCYEEDAVGNVTITNGSIDGFTTASVDIEHIADGPGAGLKGDSAWLEFTNGDLLNIAIHSGYEKVWTRISGSWTLQYDGSATSSMAVEWEESGNDYLCKIGGVTRYTAVNWGVAKTPSHIAFEAYNSKSGFDNLVVEDGSGNNIIISDPTGDACIIFSSSSSASNSSSSESLSSSSSDSNSSSSSWSASLSFSSSSSEGI